MRTVAVIGKNFGDEGKGLAVDFLAQHSERPLVVRHNGGAQSGHTVERRGPGKRFVFHELSSGSFCGADTLWISSFHPDLYKLDEEIGQFRSAAGFVPAVYAMESTCITTPDDVLSNMALETSRGGQRHGSCGMGIWECELRTKAGFGISLGFLRRTDANGLYRQLLAIRNSYTAGRLAAAGLHSSAAAAEYLQLLSDENILKNAAETIIGNMRYVTVLSEALLKEKLEQTGTLIFETGQGLLLDQDNREYAPHISASHTGLSNPCSFLESRGYSLDEVIYVSRTYVTRHGAGMLRCECPKEQLGDIQRDRTNEPNEWQGQLRYASHENGSGFVTEVQKDLLWLNKPGTEVSLFLTHLNETGGCVVMKDRRIPAESFRELPEIRETFSKFYLSASPLSEETAVTP